MRQLAASYIFGFRHGRHLLLSCGSRSRVAVLDMRSEFFSCPRPGKHPASCSEDCSRFHPPEIHVGLTKNARPCRSRTKISAAGQLNPPCFIGTVLSDSYIAPSSRLQIEQLGRTRTVKKLVVTSGIY